MQAIDAFANLNREHISAAPATSPASSTVSQPSHLSMAAPSAPWVPLDLPSGGCFADCAAGNWIGQLGELHRRVAQVLSGPTARLLVSLYQVLRPIGAVFVVRWPPMYTEFLEAIGAHRRCPFHSRLAHLAARPPSPVHI